MKRVAILWGAIVILCALGALAGHRMGYRSVATQRAESELARTDDAEREGADVRKGRPASPRPDGAREIARRMKKAAQTMDREGWSEAGARLENLSQDQLLVVLDELAGLGNLRLRSQASRQILGRLALLNPALALEVAPKYLSGFNLQHAQSAALREWARLDPDAALEQAQTMAASSPQWSFNYVQAVFASWGAQDLERALERAREVERGSAFDGALSGLARAAGQNPDERERLRELAAVLAKEATREQFVTQGVRAWGQQGNRDEVEAWIDAQEVEADFRAAMLRSLAVATGLSNPRSTAEWLMSRSTPQSRSADLRTVVEIWADDHPRACGKWLEPQLNGPETDAALTEYARVLARREPDEALSWSGKIHDEDTRMDSYANAVMRMGPVSAGEVRRRLEKAALPEELVTHLLETRGER